MISVGIHGTECRRGTSGGTGSTGVVMAMTRLQVDAERGEKNQDRARIASV